MGQADGHNAGRKGIASTLEGRFQTIITNALNDNNASDTSSNNSNLHESVSFALLTTDGNVPKLCIENRGVLTASLVRRLALR